MWKQGGRSSALDRAQALLSAKRSGGGAVGSAGSLHSDAVGGSVKARSSSPHTHALLSDVSDLSSVSSAPEPGVDTLLGSAAASHGEGPPTQDLRPQIPVGGGGSRFLKKAPPPAIHSSQSPVRSRHMQQVPEHRSVSSSQRGSQAAALSKLAQIESRVRSRMQVQDHGPAESVASNMGAASPSQEAPVRLSAQSNSEQSRGGKHFLKNKTAGAAGSPDVGVRSRSRAAEFAGPAAGLDRKPVRGVSLESDEEDMRKLLGESLDSEDHSFLAPVRASSLRTADKMLSRSSQRGRSPSPPPYVSPSSSSLPEPPSPASPPRHGSPFRFTGQAQAQFSPSLLSPSPSPHRGGSPPRSLSSISGRGEVLSLEELFSEDPHREMSAVSSEDGQQDFKINVMTLDDLVPATLGFTEETPEKKSKQREVKHSSADPGSSNRHQQRPPFKEKEKKEEEEDYQSDFESVSRTDHSQVSEHLQGDAEEEEDGSVIREEASDSDLSRGRTGADYSSSFSDTRRSCSSQTSDGTGSQRRSSRSSESHSSRNSSHQGRRGASTRKVLREVAVQTQPDPLAHTGWAALGPAVGLSYMDPSPVVAHTLSAEMVEALSTFNPAVFVLNEMLKQQLAMMQSFIDSSRHLHCSLLQSLGPPDYRYTTLEDTKESVRQHRGHRLRLKAQSTSRR
ncbi:uncharacterized protein C19orf44 homolog isoform X3 [Gymnodraco acuticeps]|uniref:Uncharacterized protein C19orf44 homolog isoform X3 n=1 Tax=Gymnodraco acuticeps TaxID=8218 RepID=A0A6P8U559_GYMAC|nr:uncharacterized protein C19orf44 homolog isoform X3 [Gymnodraco acuticeps]